MVLKSYLQKRILKKENLANKRQKEMKNFLKMKSVLVLCSVKSSEEREKWQNYFKNVGGNLKKVDVVAFIQDKKHISMKDDLSDDLIYPDQISWLGKRKSMASLDNYTNFQYDLVIDLNFEDIFILNLVFVKSLAALKVGSDSKKNALDFYDLIIKTDEAHLKPKLYIDQVFYFLRQINEHGNN